MIVKKIYDIDKNIVNESKRNQIVDLVLEFLLTSQSMCGSKTIINVVGKLVAVEMAVHDNRKGLITQEYWCIVHLPSGSKNVTLRSILFDRQQHKKKSKKFFSSDVTLQAVSMNRMKKLVP